MLVGQEPHLEFFDLAMRHLDARQHHRHHHQGGLFRGNAIAEIHLGQGFGRQEGNHQRVHDLHRQFAQRKQSQRAEYQKHCLVPHSRVPSQSQAQDCKTQRKPRDAGQVDRRWPAAQQAQETHAEGQMSAGFLLQPAHAVVNQVIGDMPALAVGILRGYGNRAPGDIQFRRSALPRNALHRAPAAIARLEIGARINASRIGTQFRFHQADRLEQIGEVNARQRAQAPECVRRGDRLSRFPGMLRADNFSERLAQLPLDPALQRSQGFLFVLKLFGQANQEIRIQGDSLTLHLFEYSGEHLRAAARSGRQTVSPEIGGFAKFLRPADARRQMAEPFD